MPAVKNGGEVIVEYLACERVPYVFGLCGHGNVGLLDALYDRSDAIKTISTRHEQTAGHMADAYFRVAHRPVATLTSCGPGVKTGVSSTCHPSPRPLRQASLRSPRTPGAGALVGPG